MALGTTEASDPAPRWRTDRRAAAGAAILEAAWALAREKGLAGLTLRDLAGRLGMSAPSLYSYFASKDALYDAMFEQGYRQLLAVQISREADLRSQLRVGLESFARACLEDTARYQLLFQRTIPDFVPTESSLAAAREYYDRSMKPFIDFGLTDADVDVLTAVVTGLVDQQVSNDPGGDRWTRLIPDVVEMLATHFETPHGPTHRGSTP